MKRIFCALQSVFALFMTPLFAMEPVTLLGPVPAIDQVYSAGTSTAITYTLINHVPKTLPLTISGSSKSIIRTPVPNDCNNWLPAGPSTCNLGFLISPTAEDVGKAVTQTLQMDYQGRVPLISTISFTTTQSAYVTQLSSPPSQVLKFMVNPVNGLFGSSLPAISSTTQQYSVLVFATVGSQQYAYVTDQTGGEVYQCTLNSSGTFDGCNSALALNPGWSPRGIAFTTVNGIQYAYVTDVNQSSVYQCALNLNGSFSACIALNPVFTSVPFDAPYGISFGSVGGLQYAYVADGSGYLFQCSLDNITGEFTTCSPTPANNAPNWVPYYATIKTINGTQYAYVANNGGGGAAAASVYKCQLDNAGSLFACVTTPQLTPPSGNNWAPDYLAFATFSGIQYVYIANQNGSFGGGLYRCLVDKTGEFQNCETTGTFSPLPWQPLSLAFRFS